VGCNIYLTWLTCEMHIKFGCMCYKNLHYFLNSTRHLHLFTGNHFQAQLNMKWKQCLRLHMPKNDYWCYNLWHTIHIFSNRNHLWITLWTKMVSRQLFYLLLLSVAKIMQFQWWMNKTLKLTTPFISLPVTDVCNKSLSSGIGYILLDWNFQK